MFQKARSTGVAVLLVSFVAVLAVILTTRATSQTSKGKILPGVTVTLIHMADLHGHLMPRPNVRSDATGKTTGGLARMYTRIDEIRK